MNPSLVISIVSHRDQHVVTKLLSDISKISFRNFGSVKVIVTINLPEDESFLAMVKFPLKIVRNKTPLGFGHNHNNAFKMFDSDYFLILNPDVRIYQDIDITGVNDFSANWSCFGPLVYCVEGNLEDSARKFPTLMSLFKRLCSRQKKLDYQFVGFKPKPLIVDWVGGMFMFFKSDVFRKLDGFDESYFMYLEDVDICHRSKKAGFEVIYHPDLEIIHDARKATLKSFTHFLWHLKSFLNYYQKNHVLKNNE